MARTDSTPAKPFRVIVVGGGIVGLSISHALQLANIDHVVLEKHDKIISVRGAALVVWPNVSRIFDQFGFLDKIHKTTTPIAKECRRWPDGSVHSTGNTMMRIAEMYVDQDSGRLVQLWSTLAHTEALIFPQFRYTFYFIRPPDTCDSFVRELAG